MWGKPREERTLPEPAAVVEGGKAGKASSTTQPPTSYTLPYGEGTAGRNWQVDGYRKTGSYKNCENIVQGLPRYAYCNLLRAKRKKKEKEKNPTEVNSLNLQTVVPCK